ncbi:MAG: hypothetical protein Q9166_007519, partial [cf. Caloplaca sp. 2 TL-2023]
MDSVLLYIIGVFAIAHARPGASKTTLSNVSYVLPQADPNPSQREAEVATNTAGYLYGPSLLGNASVFPTGTLGDKRVADDVALFTKDATYITVPIEREEKPVAELITAASDDTSPEFWWTCGVAPGTFTNYTQDLFFSTVKKLTGQALEDLHKSGRLFTADHSYQA